jgi:hypothetical protein
MLLYQFANERARTGTWTELRIAFKVPLGRDMWIIQIQPYSMKTSVSQSKYHFAEAAEMQMKQ